MTVSNLLGEIKKISVFRETGLKISGRVGRHTYIFSLFFSGKNIFLFILKGILPENLKKTSMLHQ